MSEGKLDRKRSYGTVYGHSGIGFMQDDKPFRHDGTAYVEPVTSVAPFATVPTVEQIPTVEQVETRPQTHSEKMKQVWAARRAAEANANPDR
jgi:hypothetical protein